MKRSARGTEFTDCEACRSPCFRSHHGITIEVHRRSGELVSSLSLCIRCLSAVLQAALQGEEVEVDDDDE